MTDVKRTWLKNAFWETPTKELLNCISEHKEGFKDVRQVHKLKRGDPLFDECVEELTLEFIDKIQMIGSIENLKSKSNKDNLK